MKLYLSIFWKLAIAIVFTVALFAALNISLVWNKVFYTLDSEVSRRTINIGSNLANQSVHSILYNDLSSLQTLIDQAKASDPIIQYCFVVDNEKHVLAHTFEGGFPQELLNVNNASTNDTVSIVNIQAQNFHTNNIKDIMIPILYGKIGFVRIGINADVAWQELTKSLYTFITLFIAFTILGFTGAFIFSFLISNPIKKIKFAVEQIDINKIGSEEHFFIPESKNFRLFPSINVKDEIDDLTEKYNEMVNRLEITYRDLMSAQNAMIQSEKLASIGTLVAGIAHEINNPLSGLIACLRRMETQPDNLIQNIKYFNIMNDASQKIKIVVNSLLDFTRKSAGNKEIFNLCSLIERSVNLIKYSKSNFEINITGNYNQTQIPFFCNGNEMEQVFFNILKNSFDALEEKKMLEPFLNGNIHIIVFQNDNQIKINIKDNGIGIKEEDLGKVFDPFFTNKDVGKGTGLGCSICYNIIKQYNGSMNIESKHEEWTEVTIYLPK